MTDEDILSAIRAGGRPRDAAVGVLYRRHAQALLRFFVYQGASADDAKDLLQDTVVRIVRGAEGFDGTGAARAWIWQVARNVLLDFLKRRAVRAGREVAATPQEWAAIADTTAAAPSGDSSAHLVDCVDRGLQTFALEMPERAQVLTLQMQGHAVAEIAQRIGRTAAATREYLSQCRRKIEPYIAHCLDHLGPADMTRTGADTARFAEDHHCRGEGPDER